MKDPVNGCETHETAQPMAATVGDDPVSDIIDRAIGTAVSGDPTSLNSDFEDSESLKIMRKSRRFRTGRAHAKSVRAVLEQEGDDEVLIVEPPHEEADNEEENDSEGIAINLKIFNPDEYDEVEIMITIDQIIIPDYTLRPVGPEHLEVMYALLSKHGYRTSTGVLSVTVRKSKNPGLETTLVDAITSIQGTNPFPFMKDNIRCDIVDGLHRHSAMNRMKEGLNVPPWLSEPLRIVLVRRKDGEDMSHTEILQHAKLRNHRAHSVKKDTDFIDFIYSVMSYIKSLAKDNEIDQSDLQVKQVAASMESAGYLTSKTSYKRYSRIGKCFCAIQEAVDNLHSFMNAKSAAQRARLGPTHVDTTFFNDTCKNEVEAWFILEALAVRLTDPPQTPRGKGKGVFPYNGFYEVSEFMLTELRKCFDEFKDDEENFSTFLNRQFALSNANKPVIRAHAILLLQQIVDTKVSTNMCLKSCKRMIDKIRAEYAEVVEVSNPQPTRKRKRTKSSSSFSVQPLKRKRGKPLTRRAKRAAAAATSPAVKKPGKRTNQQQVEDSDNEAENGEDEEEGNENENAEDQEANESEQEATEVQDEIQELFDDQLPPLSNAKFSNEGFQGNRYAKWTQKLAAHWSVLLQGCPSEAKEFRTPALHSAHLEAGHRAYDFVGPEDILSLHKCLWHLASQKGHTSYGDESATDPQEPSDAVSILKSSTYFTKCRAELDNRGYCILEGFGDHSKVEKKYWARDTSNGVFSSFGAVCDEFTKPLEDMFQRFQKEFDKESKEEKTHNAIEGADPYLRTMFRPIVNLGLPKTDDKNNDRHQSRYQSTNECVTTFAEETGRRWMAVRRALLDTWLGLVACALQLINTEGGSRCWFPKSGGRFLATGVGCPRQTAHNDFPHDKYDPNDPKSIPGYFFIVSGDAEFPLWVLPGSHWTHNHSHWRRNLIGVFMKMSKIIVPKNSIFIGHGLLTHAGGLGRSNHA